MANNKRGSATMDEEAQEDIARQGGRSSNISRDQASEIGRKGGEASRQDLPSDTEPMNGEGEEGGES